MHEEGLFVPGRTYRRRDLHKRLGGQRQGGISTPKSRNIILLFTGESGKQHGYDDDWTDDGIFLYTGEGQHGDMRFVAGNKAIRDHSITGKDLHLAGPGTPCTREDGVQGSLVIATSLNRVFEGCLKTSENVDL